MNRRSTALLLLPLLLAGCATNQLSQYYVDKTGGAPVPKELCKVVPGVREGKGRNLSKAVWSYWGIQINGPPTLRPSRN